MHLDSFWVSVSDLIHFFHVYAALKQWQQILLQIAAFFQPVISIIWFI